MIANADGSIILETKIDTNGITKDMAKVKGDVKSASGGFRDLGKTIQTALNSGNTQVATLANNFRKANDAVDKQAQKVEELRERYAQLQQLSSLEEKRGALGSLAVDARRSGDTERYEHLRAEIDNVTIAAETMREALGMKSADTQTEIDQLNAKLTTEEEKLRNVSTQAEIAGQKLKGATSSAGAGAIEAGKGFEKFAKRISGLAKRVFIFSVITKALRALRSILSNVLQGDEEFEQSLNELKAALWTAFTPLLEIIIPALKTLVNWLTMATTSLTQFVAKLFNVPYSKLVNDAKKMAKQAQKETKKAVDGQMAAFDELNTIGDDGNDDTANLLNNAFESIGTFSIDGISEKMAKLMKIIGGALLAVGVILLFLGHFAIGVGAMIAGLAIFGIGAESISKTDPTQTPKKQLYELVAIAGGFLLAIGLILLAFGRVVLGIAAIAAGVVALGISEKNTSDSESGGIVSKFLQDNAALITGASLALLILGVILCIAQIWPLGIGLIAVGAVGLAAEVAINWNAISDNITKFFQDNAWLIAGMSLALLLLGVLLCITGVGIPLGIALIAAGAAGLVGTIALNWDAITEKVTKIKNKIGDIFKKLWDGIKSGFKAMVNGIIWYANKWIDGLNFMLSPLRLIITGIAKAFGQNVSLDDIKISHIPKLATGGIVPHATMAVVGEAGKEAVLPLENNTEWMDTLASKIAAQMPQNAGGQRIEVPVYIDSRQVAKAVREGDAKLGTSIVSGGFAHAY